MPYKFELIVPSVKLHQVLRGNIRYHIVSGCLNMKTDIYKLNTMCKELQPESENALVVLNFCIFCLNN